MGRKKYRRTSQQGGKVALAIILSIIAGAFGVLQGGMNKQIADSLGFSASLLFNGFFLLIF